MTSDEFNLTKPRGEVTIEHAGKTYKAFVCHGCQSCWFVVPDTDEDEIEEAYPHFLFFEEVRDDR